MALTKIQAAMVDADVATQAELDAAIAAEVTARNAAIAAGNVKLTGDTVQVQRTQTGAVATGTTLMPNDDTIPQITEGDQYMTQAITPTNASNLLEIEVIAFLANSFNGAALACALFQDSTANALACSVVNYPAAGYITALRFTHRMVAGTTSLTTFRVRAGCNGSGTTTFNGSGGTRYYGGVLASSITIREIKA